MAGTAFEVRRKEVRDQLEIFIPSYKNLLPKGYAPDRLITGAMVAMTLEPKILECSPISIATSLARIAQWGLDVGDTAHLVPFGKTCTPVADYKGVVLQMLRGGARKVEAHEVREGDVFRYEYGTEPKLVHEPKGSTAPITHAYAIAWMRSGAVVFEVMTIEEIEAIRKAKSQSWKNGPMPKWYARKTVVKQLSKYNEKSSKDYKRIEDDDEVEVVAGDPLSQALADARPEPQMIIAAAKDTQASGTVEESPPEPKADPSTPQQQSLLERMMGSRVWTDEERAKYRADAEGRSRDEMNQILEAIRNEGVKRKKVADDAEAAAILAKAEAAKRDEQGDAFEDQPNDPYALFPGEKETI